MIGTFEGTAKRKPMLIAHMDTVYQPGILKTEPYHVDGDLIYGPGIADDKSGIAVILRSLQILKDMGWRDYAKLTASFNLDEESARSVRARSSPSSAAKHGTKKPCSASWFP